MMGLLQYIAPTLQFLIGVLLYHEPFTQALHRILDGVGGVGAIALELELGPANWGRSQIWVADSSCF
jgi:hypothetical protein